MTNPVLLQSTTIAAPIGWIDCPLAAKYDRFLLTISGLTIHAVTDTTGNDYLSFAFSEDHGATFHANPGEYQSQIHRLVPTPVAASGLQVLQFYDALGCPSFVYNQPVDNGSGRDGKLDGYRAEWTIIPDNHATVISDGVGSMGGGYIYREHGVARLETTTNRQNLLRLRLCGNDGAVPPQYPFPPNPNDLLLSGRVRLWGYA